MFLSLYKPPNQGNQYFLNTLSNIFEDYSSTYDNHIMLGDFNLESKNNLLTFFKNSYNLFCNKNLYHNINCFRSKGSYIDLILTNGKY